jgi:hypothetical protein
LTKPPVLRNDQRAKNSLLHRWSNVNINLQTRRCAYAAITREYPRLRRYSQFKNRLFLAVVAAAVTAAAAVIIGVVVVIA